MLRELKPYVVIATITREVEFRVDARTSEEAEGVAEAYFEDGEPEAFQTITQSIEISEAFPEEVDPTEVA